MVIVLETGLAVSWRPLKRQHDRAFEHEAPSLRYDLAVVKLRPRVRKSVELDEATLQGTWIGFENVSAEPAMILGFFNKPGFEQCLRFISSAKEKNTFSPPQASCKLFVKNATRHETVMFAHLSPVSLRQHEPHTET